MSLSNHKYRTAKHRQKLWIIFTLVLLVTVYSVLQIELTRSYLPFVTSSNVDRFRIYLVNVNGPKKEIYKMPKYLLFHRMAKTGSSAFQKTLEIFRNKTKFAIATGLATSLAFQKQEIGSYEQIKPSYLI